MRLKTFFLAICAVLFLASGLARAQNSPNIGITEKDLLRRFNEFAAQNGHVPLDVSDRELQGYLVAYHSATVPYDFMLILQPVEEGKDDRLAVVSFIVPTPFDDNRAVTRKTLISLCRAITDEATEKDVDNALEQLRPESGLPYDQGSSAKSRIADINFSWSFLDSTGLHLTIYKDGALDDDQP